MVGYIMQGEVTVSSFHCSFQLILTAALAEVKLLSLCKNIKLKKHSINTEFFKMQNHLIKHHIHIIIHYERSLGQLPAFYSFVPSIVLLSKEACHHIAYTKSKGPISHLKLPLTICLICQLVRLI